MTGVEVRLPTVLADVAGGRRIVVMSPTPVSLGALLDGLEADLPAVVRRIRDETGALRRFVNVYVDGEDVRHLEGTATPLRDGCLVQVLPSVAGG